MNDCRCAVLMFSQKVVVDPQAQFVIVAWICNGALRSRLALLDILFPHGRAEEQRFCTSDCNTVVSL